jgi:hypothetical protein
MNGHTVEQKSFSWRRAVFNPANMVAGVIFGLIAFSFFNSYEFKEKTKPVAQVTVPQKFLSQCKLTLKEKNKISKPGCFAVRKGDGKVFLINASPDASKESVNTLGFGDVVGVPVLYREFFSEQSKFGNVIYPDDPEWSKYAFRFVTTAR